MELNKELISEVLNKKIVKIWEEDNNIVYTIFVTLPNGGLSSQTELINKHELIYNMRVWASKKGFCVYARISEMDDYEWLLYIEPYVFNKEVPYEIDEYPFKTEFEAIHTACLWVYENRSC